MLKRHHIGKPTHNFPALIAGPILLFYVIIYGGGYTVDDARAQGWLFPKGDANSTVAFYGSWDALYGGMGAGQVSWGSLAGCLPTWIVMLLIVLLDDMLKLASTEASLAIDFDYNAEMRVGGCGAGVFLRQPREGRWAQESRAPMARARRT